ERPESEGLHAVQVVVGPVVRCVLVELDADPPAPEGTAGLDVTHDRPEPGDKADLHSTASLSDLARLDRLDVLRYIVSQRRTIARRKEVAMREAHRRAHERHHHEGGRPPGGRHGL